MREKIVIGPINKGLKTDREPFVIDNDSFPVLINAYQWRGRIKRKRGTSLLGRLRRYFDSTSTAYSATATITLSGGAANILTGFGLQANGNIFPGSVTITDVTTSNVYTDPAMDGTLVGTPSGTGTINYATGAITIAAGASDVISVKFNYYPDLPVMGLEDLTLTTSPFPGTIAFDQKYSYNILTNSPFSIYDVSFYKNPPTGTYVGYVQKTTVTPATWNGQNYQQFWTTNYQGALWATNGITIPFTTANIGMQYKPIVTTTVTSGGPPAIVTLNILAHGLVVGDFVYINEVATTTGINYQTGYVVTVIDANNVSVEFPNATISTNGTGGIAQYLTANADATKDGIRWYDGDPTDGNATLPTLDGRKGWVNFAPPLSNSAFSISDLPAAKYYLVGARLIVPFKDRLLFFGPVVQTSVAGSQMYLEDTVIYSQNGTPYYTSSFTGSATSTATTFNPVLVPINQTATAPAYFEDISGYGGFISAGVQQAITTVTSNEDVLIVGFNTQQSRLVYTGNDVIPFNFFTINSELGSGSTFSAINMNLGAITIGSRGIIISTQTGSTRIDLDIPDQIFQFNLGNNGDQRVCAQRDFINEWVYFTYLSNGSAYIFPNQTLLYNYRDDSWGIFNESYTTYGQFRRQTGNTWATIGTIFPTWADWNETWSAGSTTLFQPQVIGGNQQGFVIFRDDGTGESNSLYIQNIVGKTVTSPSHGLSTGDYIIISGVIGTVASQVNGNVFSVANATTDTFDLNPTITGGTYLGRGLIKRMYIPFIQTKQFPVSWGMSRKTRIGPQQYLLSTTQDGQIELQIYLSQDSSNPYNFGPVIPSTNVSNNSLIYTDILYTCPESTNIGLTPANTNLNMVTASSQSQIWHRMNTSLLGDTVQIGFTLSDAQMRDPDKEVQFEEIELHSIILDVSPSGVLA